MFALTKTAVLQNTYLNTKSILLSFLKKTSMTLLCSLSVRFSSNNKSFSIDMEASAESRVCPVVFLAYVLIRFKAENDRSTEAVDTGIVTAKQASA